MIPKLPGRIDNFLKNELKKRLEWGLVARRSKSFAKFSPFFANRATSTVNFVKANPELTCYQNYKMLKKQHSRQWHKTCCK